MAKAPAKIRFKTRLLQPAAIAKGESWAFLVLPKAASARLPTRSMTSVDGTLNGSPFRATLEPDGQLSHWLKVTAKMRESAGVEVGDMVALEIVPSMEQLEPEVPADLHKALAAAPQALSVWSDISPVARRDWIHWITSARRPETRDRRVHNACEMLASGKRRVCCFDRSGFYSKSFASPEAAGT